MYTVDHVMSLDDFTPHGLGMNRATQERQSPMIARAPPGRSLAERNLDKPRVLPSTWVSAQAKVSSSDFCEETINDAVREHQMNTRRLEAAYRGVLANAALKYRW